jgi:hypothetical protein
MHLTPTALFILIIDLVEREVLHPLITERHHDHFKSSALESQLAPYITNECQCLQPCG